MTAADLALEGRLDKLNLWKRGDLRAPHKPLALLFALGRVQQGKPRMVGFVEFDATVGKLLEEFGAGETDSLYPFWHMRTDRVWEVVDHEDVQRRKGKDRPTRTGLLASPAAGGLPKQDFDRLRQNPAAVVACAKRLLETHFPESQHEAIRGAVGLDLVLPAPDAGQRPKRDPAFRKIVLEAYDHRCAVCGFHGLLDGAAIGLDAAHVHWHSHGGPDSIDNGLALCAMHHMLLDAGTYGITDGGKVVVSSRLTQSDEAKAVIGRFHGHPLRLPKSGFSPPAQVRREWHWRQVFKKPPTPLCAALP